jgi:solute carrier family 25 protein 34/35
MTTTNTNDKIPGLGFLLGGLAACGAVTFTNPWEVVKTRLQLQGELMRSAQVKRVYFGVGDAFIKIATKEGLAGLQRGLLPAYLYQLMTNGLRFGGYEPLKSIMTRMISPEDYRSGRINSLANVLSGAIAGVVGAAIGSPFFLVKTRIQAYSPNLAAVGVQHRYRGMADAFQSIVRTDGYRGLFGGAEAAMLRTGIGRYYNSRLIFKYLNVLVVFNWLHTIDAGIWQSTLWPFRIIFGQILLLR